MPSSDFICPVCGAEVYANAKACPECGADDRSGWREDAEQIDSYSSLNLSDEEDFNYDKFVAEEFGTGTEKKPLKDLIWWIVAIILLVSFLLVFVLQGLL